MIMNLLADKQGNREKYKKGSKAFYDRNCTGCNKKVGLNTVGGFSSLALKVSGNSRSWILNMLIGTRVNKEGKEVPNRLSSD